MRKRTVVLLAAIATSLLLASSVALAAIIECQNRVGNVCVGTAQADVMYGTSRNDHVRAAGGNDEVLARDGNDRLAGGLGEDTLRGGEGDDAYAFTDAWGQDSLGDPSGTDTLDFSALASSAVVVNLVSSANAEAQSGENTLNWPSRVIVERVRGGSGSDRVEANDARNLLAGNGGGDDLSGSGGDDVLRGGTDFDYLRGGPGADYLEGGTAGDSYIFEDGWGADTISDPSGFDFLDFNFSTAPVEVNLRPRRSSPEARSGMNTVDFGVTTVIEQVLGGFADDSILGHNGDDALEGDEGDDTINGRSGADGIGGGNGDDHLTGGPGPDIIGARNGDDIIRAADGEGDVISCGDGFDILYYDADLDEDLGKCDKLIPAN